MIVMPVTGVLLRIVIFLVCLSAGAIFCMFLANVWLPSENAFIDMANKVSLVSTFGWMVLIPILLVVGAIEGVRTWIKFRKIDTEADDPQV